ncbi:MAG: dihydropteroate synthase, partial [Elusimicrobiota bacterium]|nr:dihydropteroate synthase [Elusimicrobiota bacterium]
DIGLGFAKTKEQNWFLLDNLEYFAPLNLPMLVGASRKNFTGGALESSLKAAKTSAQKNAAILRVHDVKETKIMLEELYAKKV